MIRLEIVGTPAAKGSSRAMMVGGKPRVIASGSTANQRAQKSWGESVASAIARLKSDAGIFRVDGAIQAAPLDCAVVTATIYRLPPLRAHFDEHGPKVDAPLVARTGKDLEKLARATNDLVTVAGGVWTDDARVAISYTARLFALPGAWQGAIMLIGAYDPYDGEQAQVEALWTEIMGDMARALVSSIAEAGTARRLARQSKRRAPKRQSRAQGEPERESIDPADARYYQAPLAAFDRDVAELEREERAGLYAMAPSVESTPDILGAVPRDAEDFG